jgi:hypothetical protein
VKAENDVRARAVYDKGRPVEQGAPLSLQRSVCARVTRCVLDSEESRDRLTARWAFSAYATVKQLEV